MATIPVLDYIANVIEDTYVNLKTAVGIITKNLQEFADSVALDPDADNSNLAFDISRQLYSPFYFNVYTREVTTDFNNWDKGSGQQPCLCYGIIEINNETVSIHDMQLLGRVPNGDRWDWLSSAEVETVKGLISEALIGLNPVFTPNNPVYYRYSSYLNGAIVNSTDNSNITFTDELPEKTIDKSSVPFVINLADIVYDEDTDYWSDFQTSYGAFNCPVKQPLVVVTTQESFASDYVANNGATNNYMNTYLTLGGNLKVYYGDNYIIYVIPNGVKVTYDIMFNVTKEVTETINGDNPSMPPIVVPTYDDNKYGPGPEPGPEPYEDDPWSGVSFSGASVGGIGAFAKVYYMTSTELANLRSWMASINVPEGFDPMAQIVSLSQVPVELSGDAPENVVFINSSAVYDPGVTSRAVDSGVATQQSMGLPIKYALGNIDIARRMEERGEPYLDYDCQIELYLPLVGCFSLDTQAVMGRTITAEAVLDPISGTLAAYAWVEKDGEKLPIAYGSTTIGVDLPVSAQQYSVSRAALKQANAQLGTSILSSALTFIAATASGAAGSGSGAKTATGTNGLAAAGIREAGADYMKASQAGNIFGDFMQWGRTIRQLSYGNNTAVSGSFGGSTAQWSYPFDAYVKIIRPRFTKPENYNHSQGVPCIKTMTIGECTGFIQCVGVDVSGITRATDLERQAIQAALSNGVYAGGGEE